MTHHTIIPVVLGVLRAKVVRQILGAVCVRERERGGGECVREGENEYVCKRERARPDSPLRTCRPRSMPWISRTALPACHFEAGQHSLQ